MFKRARTYILGAIVAALAILYAQTSTKEAPQPLPIQWPGRNNTVLFLTDSHRGCANVLLATSHALLSEHADLEIHFASFQRLAEDVVSISRAVAEQVPGTKPIAFHEITGVPRKHSTTEMLHPPGVRGMHGFLKGLDGIMVPWTGEEYLEIYQSCLEILTRIDPLIVVFDPMFAPGIDAIDAQKRNRVILSPNTLKDSFGPVQPWGSGFWKYPAMGSGYQFPVPWRSVPANIYLNIRFIWCVAVALPSSAKMKWLESKAISSPFSLPNIYHERYMHLSASSLESDFPLTNIPKQAIPCGPIVLSTSTAAAQDADLVSWLEKAPTILINLGSIFTYDETSAVEMAKAIKTLLDKTNFQILWKFRKRSEYSDGFLSVIQEYIGKDRIKLVEWLGIDPATLMETGNIDLSINHGGASSYNEAVGTGVPQIILAVWGDTYDFAARVEYLGIGVWGNDMSAPGWTAEELTRALERVIGEEVEAVAVRAKARELGIVSRKNPGRARAAGVVAGLARRVV